MKKFLKIARIVLIVLLLFIVGFIVMWKNSDGFKTGVIKFASKLSIVRNLVDMEVGDEYANSVQDTEFDKSKLNINEHVKETLTGYTNIALFGIDTRNDSSDSFEGGTRSDSIIVISINNNTSEVKMVSLYRDTYLEYIDDDDYVHYGKCNAAYAKGGAAEAVRMLNKNLDLNISDYVVVNFSGLANIIDLFGGIDVTITEDEMKYVNKYITDMSKETNLKGERITEYGKVHLDGIQGLAYCRIRYTAYYDENGKKYTNDLGRTARQRAVLELLVKKAKKMGVNDLLKLAKSIMALNTADEMFIKTSLTTDEILNLVPFLIDYNIVSNSGFPYTLSTPTINGASLVVAQGLAYNVSHLHEELFEDEDYEVSEECQAISDYIMKKTGVKEVRLPEKKEEETTTEAE